MEYKTSKRELNTLLAKLQAAQRKCYKEGSTKSLEIHPKFYSAPDAFAITATAYNEEKTRENGNEIYDFVIGNFYSFHEMEENEKELRNILEWLDL